MGALAAAQAVAAMVVVREGTEAEAVTEAAGSAAEVRVAEMVATAARSVAAVWEEDTVATAVVKVVAAMAAAKEEEGRAGARGEGWAAQRAVEDLV